MFNDDCMQYKICILNLKATRCLLSTVKAIWKNDKTLIFHGKPVFDLDANGHWNYQPFAENRLDFGYGEIIALSVYCRCSRAITVIFSLKCWFAMKFGIFHWFVGILLNFSDMNVRMGKDTRPNYRKLLFVSVWEMCS